MVDEKGMNNDNMDMVDVRDGEEMMNINYKWLSKKKSVD